MLPITNLLYPLVYSTFLQYILVPSHTPLQTTLQNSTMSHSFNLRYSSSHASINCVLVGSYRTTLCLQYTPSQIALAAIFLASIQLSVKPLVPSKHRGVEQSWYELLEPEIDEDSLKSKLFFRIF